MLVCSVRAVPMRLQIVNAFRKLQMVSMVEIVDDCSMFRLIDCVQNRSIVVFDERLIVVFDERSIVSGDCFELVVWFSLVRLVLLIDCVQYRLFGFRLIDFANMPNKNKSKQNLKLDNKNN